MEYNKKYNKNIKMTICDWPLAPYHFVAPYFTMALYPVIVLWHYMYFYGTAYCDTAVFYIWHFIHLWQNRNRYTYNNIIEKFDLKRDNIKYI